MHDTEQQRRLFRQVMSRFTTGVTVITTAVDGEIHGMTANAFLAGSLDPLLCVVSINRAARMHARLHGTRRYGVSFLSQEQQHLSAYFARQVVRHLEPEFIYRGSVPVLARAVAFVTAEVLDTAECGDHTLFIGQITHMELGEGQPLLFYAGRYARIDRLHPIEEVEPPEFW
jgi:flavin reductase (DIM6/NTAB) family NADH-FMN oxidoreductase RutF